MKSRFSKSVGWSWAKSLPFLAGLLLSPLVVMATDSGYTNTTTITGTPPQVDAINFYNFGSFGTANNPIRTGLFPYKTSDTLNYINEGTMVGSVGWDFALHPSTTGVSGMSASFSNYSLATIQAVDGTAANPSTIPISYPVSYLWISATNIVNRGTLIGGASGEIRLTGSNVDLSRSYLEINGISRSGSANISSSNYLSDMAIYDEYWGQTNTFPNSTTPYTIDSSTIWLGATAVSPIFYVTYLSLDGYCGVTNAGAQIGFPATFADSTNTINPLTITNVSYSRSNGVTNTISNLPAQIFRQAVFVYNTNANITVSNTFLSTGSISNLFQTVTVRLANSVSGENLYLVDTLASLTNRGLLNNENYLPGSNPQSSCSDPTYRPANYNLGGVDPGSFTNGSPGVGWPAANFLYAANFSYTGYPAGFSNATVQAEYAGYSAYIDNLPSDSTAAAVTDLPGRIIISADSLNLNRTVITNRGAEVVIQANNLIGAPTYVICQNLSYNIGETNGYLNVTNLVSSLGVPGWKGTLSAFSALWTNIMFQVVATNYDTNTSPVTITPVTNYTEMDFHVLLVDVSGLSAMVPSTVQDLVLHSTNMVVSDFMNVVHTLFFDGQSLTLLTNLTLSANLQNWSYVNAATNFRYFTNNGILTIPQDAHFGDDRATNYASFVNNGSIRTRSGAEVINSDYFQNSGTLIAPGGIFVTTSNGLVNGSITSGRDVDFTGRTLELDNATISVPGHLYFNLTNALYDAGVNVLTCSNGFSLLSMPASSTVNNTLMHTTITSVGLNGAEVDHVWAGQDRGATSAGFSDNVVIRKLVLTDDGSGPLFVFSGASANNGLYVSNLDLSGLSDPAYENEIQIAPNLNIYYKTVTPSGAVADLSSPAFAGHFINVPGATPYVGTQPSGPSPKFTANYVVGSGQLQFTVNDYVAGETYIVEASTNLPAGAGDWMTIFTTTAPSSGLFQFIVPDTSSYPARFYRLVPSP
jgi:hypothetical protein